MRYDISRYTAMMEASCLSKRLATLAEASGGMDAVGPRPPGASLAGGDAAKASDPAAGAGRAGSITARTITAGSARSAAPVAG